MVAAPRRAAVGAPHRVAERRKPAAPLRAPDAAAAGEAAAVKVEEV